MTTLLKHIGRWGILIMGALLLGYTALRTLDLIQLTLPANQQMTGYLALVAFDGGLLLWSVFFMYGASGIAQRALGLVMVCVSLLGVVVAFITDTFYQLTSKGLVATADPAFVETAVWVLTAVIAVNVVAVLLVHLFEPKTWRRIMDEIETDAQASLPKPNPGPAQAPIQPARLPAPADLGLAAPISTNGSSAYAAEVPAADAPKVLKKKG